MKARESIKLCIRVVVIGRAGIATAVQPAAVQDCHNRDMGWKPRWSMQLARLFVGLRRVVKVAITTRSLPSAEASAAIYADGVLGDTSRTRALAALIGAAEEMAAAGKPAEAEALYRRAATAANAGAYDSAGDELRHHAVVQLVNWPGIRDDPAAVEAVYRAAVAVGDVRSLSGLAMNRARHGDNAEARVLLEQAIGSGDVRALTTYAAFVHHFGEPGEADAAVARCRERIEAGDTGALALLGALLLRRPDVEGAAEAVLRQGAAALENRSRCLLAALLLRRGDVGEASDLVRRIRATGDEYVRAYAEDLAGEYELPV